MRARVDLVAKPPTRRASLEAIEALDNPEYGAIFLDLPRSLQRSVERLISTGEPGPLEEQLQADLALSAAAKSQETLLRLLPRVAVGRTIYCYAPYPSESERRLYAELARLLLRDSIMGRVSAEEWRSLVGEARRAAAHAVAEQALYILGIAGRFEAAVCVSDIVKAQPLRRELQRAAETRIIYTGLPHHHTPLQTLILSRREPSDREIIETVKQHIGLIRNYVIPHGLEQGVEEWADKKLRWLGLGPAQRRPAG
jgi:hypothetical protein